MVTNFMVRIQKLMIFVKMKYKAAGRRLKFCDPDDQFDL